MVHGQELSESHQPQRKHEFEYLKPTKAPVIRPSIHQARQPSLEPIA